jgi:hypothetical protein
MIGSAADLKKTGLDAAYPLAKNYILTENMELENWTPIGGDGSDSDLEPFTGSFDGANHTITIKNFDNAVFTEGPVYLGIFGYTKGSAGAKAVIKNLNVSTELDHSITRTGAYYVGAVAGYVDEYTELDNINVEGSLSFSNNNTAAPKLPVYVGGIAGVLVASELKDSQASAHITGHGRASNGAYNYVGGLAGMFDRNAVTRGLNPKPNAGESFTGSSITNCRATGNVRGTTEGAQTNIFVGGIAGGAYYGMKTYYSGKIEDCSSTGNISVHGGSYWSIAGGIVGQNQADAITRRCYSTAAVFVTAAQGGRGSASQQGAGGIAGYSTSPGIVEKCAALNPSITSAGFERVYRVIGDSGDTLIAGDNLAYSGMIIIIGENPSTNSDPGANAKDGADCDAKPAQAVYEGIGWDFTTVWKTGDKGYPVLQWQDYGV